VEFRAYNLLKGKMSKLIVLSYKGGWGHVLLHVTQEVKLAFQHLPRLFICLSMYTTAGFTSRLLSFVGYGFARAGRADSHLLALRVSDYFRIPCRGLCYNLCCDLCCDLCCSLCDSQKQVEQIRVY